jgi:hypothetical protein
MPKAARERNASFRARAPLPAPSFEVPSRKAPSASRMKSRIIIGDECQARGRNNGDWRSRRVSRRGGPSLAARRKVAGKERLDSRPLKAGEFAAQEREQISAFREQADTADPYAAGSRSKMTQCGLTSRSPVTQPLPASRETIGGRFCRAVLFGDKVDHGVRSRRWLGRSPRS